jgi:hypothetical protein
MGWTRPSVAYVFAACVVGCLGFEPAPTFADDEDGPVPIPAADRPWHGRVELRRQATSRGTPEETTKTLVRIETFFTGTVDLLRVDLPFPDQRTDVEGSPFDPRVGDIRVRLGFKPFRAREYAFPAFVEVSFPTADPAFLGSGKYQLGPGMRMLTPVNLPILGHASHQSQFEARLQQVISVAGDPSRKEINYTKVELRLTDVWREAFTFKLRLKPEIDWEQDGKTGAVGELEGGKNFAGDWRAWVMLGARLWGPSNIPTTYNTRIELGIARTF